MSGPLFRVEADTTNLVTFLCVEGGLFERLVCARTRPPVGGLFYRSLFIVPSVAFCIIVSPNGAPTERLVLKSAIGRYG